MTLSPPALPVHVPNDRLCQGVDRNEPVSAGDLFSHRPTLAGRLAAKLTGAPLLLLHPSNASGLCSLSRGPEVTTRVFADAQKVFDGSSNVQ